MGAGVLTPLQPHAGMAPNQCLDVQARDHPAPLPQMKPSLRHQLYSEPPTTSGVWEFSQNGTFVGLGVVLDWHLGLALQSLFSSPTPLQVSSKGTL